MKPPSAKVAGAGVGISAVVALALPLVASFEGFRPDPYKDIAGLNTVCFGETHAEMRHYTRDECELMLNRSLVEHTQPVLECLPKDAPIEVKAAFASFAYNAGTKAACKSSAAKKARAGDYKGACDGLLAWTFAGGRKVQGLVNRRQAERGLCLLGLKT